MVNKYVREHPLEIAIWGLLIFQIIVLLPCFKITYARVCRYFDYEIKFKLWTGSFLAEVLPVIFLSAFYIPYILLAVSILLIAIWIHQCRKNSIKIPLYKILLLILGCLICFISLFSLQIAIDAAMSV